VVSAGPCGRPKRSAEGPATSIRRRCHREQARGSGQDDCRPVPITKTLALTGLHRAGGPDFVSPGSCLSPWNTPGSRRTALDGKEIRRQIRPAKAANLFVANGQGA
jgi:hypothetical protein